MEDLDAYDVKSRARYVKDSAKGGYKEALDQIELALNGDDPAPILDDDQAVIMNETVIWLFIQFKVINIFCFIARRK